MNDQRTTLEAGRLAFGHVTLRDGADASNRLISPFENLNDTVVPNTANLLVFGTTRSPGKLAAREVNALWDTLARHEEVWIIDPKASVFALSRRRAKKRLMAAGLAPAKATAVVKSVTQSWLGASFALRDAMPHHKRHAKRWFPWDTAISTPQANNRRKARRKQQHTQSN